VTPHSYFITGLLGLTLQAQGAISLTSSSTLWTSVGAKFDFLDDQQTGAKAGDIVGDGPNPGFLTSFDPISGASARDGVLSFRVRLDDHGGNANNPQFDRVVWVGIDADLNGSIDVFVGVNRSGSSNTVGIYAPGSGANTSPSTTTIASNPFYSETLGSLNYDYRAVGAGDGGTTIDLTTATNGDVDWYVSFRIPFSSVVDALEVPSLGIHIDDTTPLRYIIATSTQGNSLNQDLGGVQGGVNSTTTWTDLGGFTPTVNVSGVPVPEPKTPLLAGLMSLALSQRRRGMLSRR
jgi:hypothetical protein